MNTSIRSIRGNPLRTVLPVAFLVTALAALSTRANAEQFDEITISAPSVKVVGYDDSTRAPRKEITVVAHVKTDPVVLTTNSGVALFKDSVMEAAQKVCGDADRGGQVDTTCLRGALKGAKP